MTEQEARFILQSYRPAVEDPHDPQIAEALRMAAENPELARWWEEEQAFDRAMATHLAAIAAPFGLKTRILAQAAAPATSRFTRWIVGLAGAAALLFLLAQVADVWRNAAPRAGALPDYASEMVSFIKVPPSLELMSGNLGAIQDWLTQKEALLPNVPARLAILDPVGCRVLSFRGHDVTLVCFQRGGDRLAHLFVVDRGALPRVQPGDKVVFQREGDWTTTTWVEGDRVYMIAVQGDEAAARQYLPHA
jgi:hypothetical protein